ncbi:hypothetical protein PG997_007047 [Apiospora hydei]|uniref:NADH dehydrogenase [ubiquinone] 1 alpha subcomplex subunit 13 n=1 Tax=Apiospora hydei TaxID=1337664 RepID=A0ABR1WS07_9PEZI
MPQDMPPSGASARFSTSETFRRLASSPPLWSSAWAPSASGGFYKLGQGIREQNELAREKMWSRIHLIPLLQAEEDRDLARRHMADQAREEAADGRQLQGLQQRQVRADFPSLLWLFVRPTYAVTPANTTK